MCMQLRLRAAGTTAGPGLRLDAGSGRAPGTVFFPDTRGAIERGNHTAAPCNTRTVSGLCMAYESHKRDISPLPSRGRRAAVNECGEMRLGPAGMRSVRG